MAQDEIARLGDQVEDRVTRYTGIVVAWHQAVFSEPRLTVQATGVSLDDGRPVPPITVPLRRVRVLQRDALGLELGAKLAGDDPRRA